MQEVLDAFEAKEAEFDAKQAEELKALIKSIHNPQNCWKRRVTRMKM